MNKDLIRLQLVLEYEKVDMILSMVLDSITSIQLHSMQLEQNIQHKLIVHFTLHQFALLHRVVIIGLYYIIVQVRK